MMQITAQLGSNIHLSKRLETLLFAWVSTNKHLIPFFLLHFVAQKREDTFFISITTLPLTNAKEDYKRH